MPKNDDLNSIPKTVYKKQNKHRHRNRLTMLAGAALSLIHASGGWAQVLPTGGSVVSGSVSFSTPTTNQLLINQDSSKAIVNWQNFSVGQGGTVNIVQPSASAALLNRVASQTPSTIAGSINANGQVFLVNPNGVAITSSGVVNAGSFVASTLDVSDTNFLNGSLNFTGDGTSASVNNAGQVNTATGGYAALLGGSVNNSGTINAPLGKVALGSGEQATLDLTGDGFLQVALPTLANGNDALVDNTGTLKASLIQLSAAAAHDSARQAVNLSGLADASSDSDRGGTIIFDGGSGSVNINGQLNASSSLNTGGQVTLAGNQINLTGAQINASGKTGGGTVSVGGGAQGVTLKNGNQSLQTANTVNFDAKSRILADASDQGNGGNVILWSTGKTTAQGQISAQGGALGGNGGLVETSSKTVNFNDLKVNTSAAKGKTGEWLVDPIDLTIDDAAAQTIDDNLIYNNVTLQTTVDSAYGPGSAVEGNGNIIIASPIQWNSGNALTLSAYNSILFNAPVTIAGPGQLILLAATDSSLMNTPKLSFMAPVQFTDPNQGGSLSINGQPYTLVYDLNYFINDHPNLSQHFALAQSIVNNQVYVSPIIGDLYNPFYGTFEGLGNSITNLTINIDGNANYYYVGLFGSTYGSVIRDLNLINPTINGSGAYYAGQIVGSMTNTLLYGVSVQNLAAIPNDSMNIYIGGLAASSNDSIISNSSVSGSINSDNSYSAYIAGLAAVSGNTTIINSYTNLNIRSPYLAGGLIGVSNGGNNISNSYVLGSIQGGFGGAGGLIGVVNLNSTPNSSVDNINNVYVNANVSGYSAGALFGSINDSKDYSSETSPDASLANLKNVYWNSDKMPNAVGRYSDNFLTMDENNNYQFINTNSTFNTTGATGLTDAQMHDNQNLVGFDFEKTWTNSDSTSTPILRSIAGDNVNAIANTALLTTAASPPIAASPPLKPTANVDSFPIDPTTGFPKNPETGELVNPTTGSPLDLDENTGFPINPTTGVPFNPTTGNPISYPNSSVPVAASPPLKPTANVDSFPIDPTTGFPKNPETGELVNPTTGSPLDLDENTGFPINPTTGVSFNPVTGVPIPEPTYVPGPVTNLPITPIIQIQDGQYSVPIAGSTSDSSITNFYKDPISGSFVNSVTGLPLVIDSSTGFPINPATGVPFNPVTGVPVPEATYMPGPVTNLPVTPVIQIQDGQYSVPIAGSTSDSPVKEVEPVIDRPINSPVKTQPEINVIKPIATSNSDLPIKNFDVSNLNEASEIDYLFKDDRNSAELNKEIKVDFTLTDNLANGTSNLICAPVVSDITNQNQLKGTLLSTDCEVSLNKK